MNTIGAAVGRAGNPVHRLLIYAIFSFVLLVICVLSGHNALPDFDVGHEVLETVSTLIAVFAGILALVRYYSKREGKILIIGSGLLGAGLLDSFDAITASTSDPGDLYLAASTSFSWSYETSRLYLSAMFVLSWLDWRLKFSVYGLGKAGEYRVYLFSALLAVICVLLFLPAQLTSPDLQKLLFNVLKIVGPGLLFTLALVGYLLKGRWQRSELEHWIILFLITNVAAQANFFTISTDAAGHSMQLLHVLKILSYLFLLIGMLNSVYQTFRESADTALEIAEANIALKLEAEERRRAQAQMVDARNQAVKSDMAKSEFLSSMSHELRTPLNSILGFGQLLETDPDIAADDIKRESVEQIVQAGRHLLELINEVLDLSRIETGNMELFIESVRVNDSIDICLSLNEPLAQQRGIQVSSSIAETEDRFVLADKTSV